MRFKGTLILFAIVAVLPLVVTQQSTLSSNVQDGPAKQVSKPVFPDEQSKQSSRRKTIEAEAAKTLSRKDKVQLVLMRAAAGRLLERAPNLKPTPLDGYRSDKDFIAAAQRYAGNTKLKTVEEAVEALEALFVGEPDVNAVVTSTPAGLPVRYRPVIDKNEPYLNTTTDNQSLPVRPITYLFTATDSNGKESTQRVACSRGCTVVFNPPF